MKTLALLALLVLSTLSIFAQGQLIFANSAPTAITNLYTAQAVPGSAAQDDTQVGLYIGNPGDAVSSLTLSGNVTNVFTAGRFSGGTRTLPGTVGGQVIQIQVRAWFASTVYPSYEAALAAAFGGDSSVNVGVSAPFNFTLTQSPTTPNSIASFGLTPIVLGVPEPSSVALGLLGLGVLLLFRRKW